MATQTLALPALPAPKPASSDLTDAIRARLALALMSGGADTSPVQHWTQGAARVMQALVGGSMLRDLAQAEQEKKAGLAALLLGHPALQSSALPEQSTAPTSTAASKAVQIPDNLRDTIVSTANRYGIDPNYALATAKLESNFNPQAKSPLSSATGLFQFIAPTWQRYGQGDILDPASNADAAMRMARDNVQFFRQRLGRDPNNAELYLLHQQGPAGAAALLANPQANAIDALTPAYRGNRALAQQAVLNNGGRPTDTAGEFAARIMQRAAAAERYFTGTGAPAPGQQMPQIAPQAAALPQMQSTAQTVAQTPLASAAPATQSSMAADTAYQGSAAAPQSGLTPELAAYIRRLFATGNDQLIAYGLNLLNAATKPQEYEFKIVGDRLVRTSKQTGVAEPLPIGATKPQYGVIAEDEYGNKIYGWIDPETQSTRRAEIPQVNSAQQPQDQQQIPKAPLGADPKLYRQEMTKRAAGEPLPAEVAGRLAMMETAQQAYQKSRQILERDWTPEMLAQYYAAKAGLGSLSGELGRARRDVRLAIEAALRAMTGAAAPETEVSRYEDMFMPTPWDDSATRQQKIKLLDDFINNARRTILQGRVLPGQIPTTTQSDAGAAPADTTAPAKIRRYNPLTGKIE